MITHENRIHMRAAGRGAIKNWLFERRKSIVAHIFSDAHHRMVVNVFFTRKLYTNLSLEKCPVWITSGKNLETAQKLHEDVQYYNIMLVSAKHQNL